jgi:hypothetical protein
MVGPQIGPRFRGTSLLEVVDTPIFGDPSSAEFSYLTGKSLGIMLEWHVRSSVNRAWAFGLSLIAVSATPYGGLHAI